MAESMFSPKPKSMGKVMTPPGFTSYDNSKEAAKSVPSMLKTPIFGMLTPSQMKAIDAQPRSTGPLAPTSSDESSAIFKGKGKSRKHRGRGKTNKRKSMRGRKHGVHR
jgi:hypothetical protein